ncbi:MAG: hypothetical protein GF332_04305 [Candidatus Moranbacteria bacterium]|nr:hypothetical protein [Candidatus Moranbacteria bacterium]
MSEFASNAFTKFAMELNKYFNNIQIRKPFGEPEDVFVKVRGYLTKLKNDLNEALEEAEERYLYDHLKSQNQKQYSKLKQKIKEIVNRINSLLPESEKDKNKNFFDPYVCMLAHQIALTNDSLEPSSETESTKLQGARNFIKAHGIKVLEQELRNLNFFIEQKRLDFVGNADLSIKEISLAELYKKLKYVDDYLRIINDYMEDSQKRELYKKYETNNNDINLGSFQEGLKELIQKKLKWAYGK